MNKGKKRKFGMIEIYYTASKLEPLGTASFPELSDIPSNEISVREAACLQSVGSVSGGICNCKSECNSNKCHYKKSGGSCSSRCHSGYSYLNKWCSICYMQLYVDTINIVKKYIVTVYHNVLHMKLIKKMNLKVNL